MHIHFHKLENDENSQSWEKSNSWLLPTIYSNVIWILRKWMQIHVRDVEISQDEQNDKKLVEKSNILLDNLINS